MVDVFSLELAARLKRFHLGFRGLAFEYAIRVFFDSNGSWFNTFFNGCVSGYVFSGRAVEVVLS